MKRVLPLLTIVSSLGLFSFTSCMTSADGQPVAKDSSKIAVTKDSIPDAAGIAGSTSAPLDTALFNRMVTKITNGDSSGKWPVKTAYPLPGAILPFKRVIA